MTTTLHVDPHGRPGGGQLGLARLLQRPSRLRHEALFLTGGPVVDRLIEAGAPVRLGGLESDGVADLVRGASSVRTEIERARADVVIANGMRAALAIALARPRVPSVLAYLRMDLTRQSSGVVRREIEARMVLRQFDGLLVNSRWTGTTLHPALRSKPTAVAYPLCGIDPLLDQARVPGEQLLRLLFVGRLGPWKGAHLAVEALRRLTVTERSRDVALTIAGEPAPGDERYASDLRRASAGLPVTFVGHVWDLAPVLARHDVLLHTTTRPEPFGQVVAQAAAAGMVVVTTPEGGQVEITGQDGAAFFRSGDAESLAATVAALAADRERADTISTTARRRARKFSDGSAVRMLDEAVERLGAR